MYFYYFFSLYLEGLGIYSKHPKKYKLETN